MISMEPSYHEENLDGIVGNLDISLFMSYAPKPLFFTPSHVAQNFLRAWIVSLHKWNSMEYVRLSKIRVYNNLPMLIYKYYLT